MNNPNVKDLTGERFGRLVAVNRVENGKHRQSKWLCKCDCGNYCIVFSANLKRMHTQSCGCHRVNTSSMKHRKHGMHNTKIYNAWNGMKSRCFNKNDKYYLNYGGRGITVCDEWKNDFKAFFDWAMENGYSDKLTIDRIDVNGNYEPSNCRWVTQKVQQNNRTNNVLLEFLGEIHTISEWSELLGIDKATIHARYKAGRNINEILSKSDLRKEKKNGIKGKTNNIS